MKSLTQDEYDCLCSHFVYDDLVEKLLTMSNAMRKIEELTQLWRTQAESYKEQEEAVLMVPLGTAAAATVNACVRELEEILND
jgi:pyruvate/2-oxoacid:ferredoxin oxidoreductase alpha subunit